MIFFQLQREQGGWKKIIHPNLVLREKKRISVKGPKLPHLPRIPRGGKLFTATESGKRKFSSQERETNKRQIGSSYRTNMETEGKHMGYKPNLSHSIYICTTPFYLPPHSHTLKQRKKL